MAWQIATARGAVAIESIAWSIAKLGYAFDIKTMMSVMIRRTTTHDAMTRMTRLFLPKPSSLRSA